MIRFLKKALNVLGGSFGKFINFLLEVWKGVTSAVLEENYKYINEAVLNVEQIGNYILANSDKTSVWLAGELKRRFGYREIDIEFVEKFIHEQNTKYEIIKCAKYNLAYQIIKNRIKAEGKSFVSRSINLGIELAVSRFFD
jgi:hypothetical protein